MRYDPNQMIDTLRVFIDLVGFESDMWTSGYLLLSHLGRCHMGRHDTDEGRGDVFLWTLEMLGPDYWTSLNKDALYLLMRWCIKSEERRHRLHRLCSNDMNARNAVDGYSLLHTEVVEGDPIHLLNMGANPNLVGFDPKQSPHRETPISVSMYRANSFVTMQRALKITTANLGTIFDQALEQYPFQHSTWTKEALVELFSEEMELEPIIYDQLDVCPYCLHSRDFIVQPYWMRILDSIMSRGRSQSIHDTGETMLSTSSQVAEVNRDDYEEADHDIDDVNLSNRDNESVSVQSDDAVRRGFHIYDNISVYEEDMCLFCWQEWRETGVKPSLDKSKCLCCDRSLSLVHCCGGRGDYNELCCKYCAANHQQADLAMEQQQNRRPTTPVDSEDEEDHYSPYLIHT